MIISVRKRRRERLSWQDWVRYRTVHDMEHEYIESHSPELSDSEGNWSSSSDGWVCSHSDGTFSSGVECPR